MGEMKRYRVMISMFPGQWTHFVGDEYRWNWVARLRAWDRRRAGFDVKIEDTWAR